MKKHLIIILTALSLFSCGDAEKKFDGQTYEKAKESVSDKEKKNPVAFLQVKGSDRRGWFGKTVVKGIVYNKASLIAYKDIRVKMLFYNKEGKLVVNHEDIYTETLAPNSSMKFKARYGTPKGTDSVALSIMSAVAVTENAK